MALFLIVLGVVAPAEARERVRVVGSATVLPFVRTVAEQFARHFGHPGPSLEVTGAGPGFRLFCAGIGFEHPDVVVAARRISEAELEACKRNGVEAVTEIEFGWDAVTVISDKRSPRRDLSRTQLFAALAREVEVGGVLVTNTAGKWSDIDSALPVIPIRVMGPSADSSTWDALFDLIMEPGCRRFPAIERLDAQRRTEVCRSLRTDGAYSQGSRSEAEVIRWLRADPAAVAISSYTMATHNEETVAASPVEGIVPSKETISNGQYPLAWPLFIYVKAVHVGSVPGLQEFLYELTSERAIGAEGYLAAQGFVPLDDLSRDRARDRALSLESLGH